MSKLVVSLILRSTLKSGDKMTLQEFYQKMKELTDYYLPKPKEKPNDTRTESKRQETTTRG